MFFRANCDRCDYQRPMMVRQPSHYDMGELKVIVNSEFAWCDSCAAVEWAENLKTVAEWEEELAEMRAQTDEEFAAKFGFPEWMDLRETKEAFIKEYENTVMWRRDRRSPAKCLECGSISFQLATLIHEAGDFLDVVTHPACGGTIRIRARGFAQPAYRYDYTPEGERIGGYGRPD